MKTPNLSASTWLLAAGVGIVLFIGAFARFEPASSALMTAAPATAPPPLTEATAPIEASGEPTWPANLSPGLAEIIKLAQAHVDEGVILAYVKNSGQLYSPSADEILYLKDLGLSQDVIAALFKGAPPVTPQAPEETVAAVAPAPPPPAPPSTVLPASAPPADLFHDELARYGVWSQEPDYGPCWQPTVETVNPDWRPYFDAGQWLYSDSGWYWQSDYSWGWAVFHYGRWVNLPRRGWMWTPGTLWAPAWVAWRATPSYIGWAPLPPGVGLNVLAQLTYGRQPAGHNPSLGLAASSYTFVSAGNFLSRNLPRRAVPAQRAAALVQVTSVIDGYALVNNRIFNGGISREAVAVAAHKAVPEIALRAVFSPKSAGLGPDGKTLAVYLPGHAGESGAAPASAGTLPVNKSADLAGDDGAEPAIEAPGSAGARPIVQLPPLRYPVPSSPPRAGSHGPSASSAAGLESQGVRHGRPREAGMIAVERPSSPAPALESPASGQREARPRAVAENRPAPVEPPRAVAPAPAPPPQPSSAPASRSGK
jgi:hypothetical protein